jgi:hypothetical protein
MREVNVTVDNTGYSPVVPLDQYLTPFSVTYKASAGTVQVTTDSPFTNDITGKYVAPTMTWVSAPTTGPNASGFLGQPFRAIRLSGSAGDTLTVIQAGIK